MGCSAWEWGACKTDTVGKGGLSSQVKEGLAQGREGKERLVEACALHGSIPGHHYHNNSKLSGIHILSTLSYFKLF